MSIKKENGKGQFAGWKAPDSAEQANSFELQYIRKENFVINGAGVESIDIRPETQKNEVPVLVVPGWGATMESFKPGIKVLANKNRRVVSLDFPRKGGTIPASYNEEIKKWYREKGKKYPKWPKEEIRKAQTILGLLEKKQLDKTDVIAHSEAAINVTIAAMLHPEKFKGRTLVYYSPAGIIGKDSLLRLAKGAGANTSRTKTVADIPITETETEYLESTKHITPDYMSANRLRAFKEILAISQAQVEDMFKYLREQGIRIIVMAAVDDTMFPMEKMQTNPKLKSDLSKTGPNEGIVDGFVSVRGGHMQIQVHPELYMSAAESFLEQPQKYRKRPGIAPICIFYRL